MLMKLTAGVDFINILRTTLLFQGGRWLAQLFQFGFQTFFLLQKWARKLLMKLITEVNFINVLCTPFTYESLLGSFLLVTCK